MYFDNYELRSWLNNLQLGYIDPKLILIAFTHRSFKGMGYNGEDNERLEFLGDAILDLINAELLYYEEDLTEEEMTELRKNYVNNSQLAIIFDKLNIEQFIRTANNLKISQRIKAGFVEAFFGAIYISKGYETCVNLWETITGNLVTTYRPQRNQIDFYNTIYHGFAPSLKNAKTTLQEFCQSQLFESPEYQVVKRKGPDHDPTYTVKVIIRPGSNIISYENLFDTYVIDKPYVTEYANGKNIKLAEKRAAEKMCDRIGLIYSSEIYE